MSSFAKKEANRKNAKKSTGPKSIDGKSKSSQNAVKHGAYATRHLLVGEDKELYEAIKLEQRRAFKPNSFIEVALVDELINQLWTLRRLERAERYYLSECRAEQAEDSDDSPFHALAKQVSPLREVADKSPKSPNDTQQELYKSAYIYDETGRMERLSTRKRLALQTILSIERELERRLKAQKKIKNNVAGGGA